MKVEFAELMPANEYILSHYDTILTRNDFSATVTDTTTGTIYKSLDETQYDNDGEVYYFAGNPTDNWVQFGGFYWRIIRINGNGSIRMIYQGTEGDAIGEDTILESNKFNASPNHNRSEYVGYMYTNEEQFGIQNSSTIKEVVDQWFVDYLISYSNYLDIDSGFCGDRNIANGYNWASLPTSDIYYSAYERLSQTSTNINPSFNCNGLNDLFTTSRSDKGNQALTYPIGLITADEVIIAGMSFFTTNISNYLYTGQYYWTMTPYYFNSLANTATEYCVWNTGQLSANHVLGTAGVRPVINLRTDVSLTGSGTVDDPYVIA